MSATGFKIDAMTVNVQLSHSADRFKMHMEYTPSLGSNESEPEEVRAADCAKMSSAKTFEIVKNGFKRLANEQTISLEKKEKTEDGMRCIVKIPVSNLETYFQSMATIMSTALPKHHELSVKSFEAHHFSISYEEFMKRNIALQCTMLKLAPVMNQYSSDAVVLQQLGDRIQEIAAESEDTTFKSDLARIIEMETEAEAVAAFKTFADQLLKSAPKFVYLPR